MANEYAIIIKGCAINLFDRAIIIEGCAINRYNRAINI